MLTGVNINTRDNTGVNNELNIFFFQMIQCQPQAAVINTSGKNGKNNDYCMLF